MLNIAWTWVTTGRWWVVSYLLAAVAGTVLAWLT
jgi:hypothetical protein